MIGSDRSRKKEEKKRVYINRKKVNKKQAFPPGLWSKCLKKLAFANKNPRLPDKMNENFQYKHTSYIRGILQKW